MRRSIPVIVQEEGGAVTVGTTHRTPHYPWRTSILRWTPCNPHRSPWMAIRRQTSTTELVTGGPVWGGKKQAVSWRSPCGGSQGRLRTGVFKHVTQPAGVSHPVFPLIRRLVDEGRTWVKLSLTYDNTKDGPPGYADITRVAQAYVKAAPQRMVWGSNWPHPNETTKPDDALLFDLMSQ